MNKYFTLNFPKNRAGFTLIELLVVIAVIGVLAAVVITVLNPIEQIAKGNDVGRTNSVSQLGKAVELYFLANNAYPTANATWQNSLMPTTGTGDIKQLITVPAPAAGCTLNAHGNVCYTTNGTSDAIVWTPIESGSEKRIAGCASFTVVAWDARQGKTGLMCTSALNAAPTYGSAMY